MLKGVNSVALRSRPLNFHVFIDIVLGVLFWTLKYCVMFFFFILGDRVSEGTAVM